MTSPLGSFLMMATLASQPLLEKGLPSLKPTAPALAANVQDETAPKALRDEPALLAFLPVYSYLELLNRSLGDARRLLETEERHRPEALRPLLTDIPAGFLPALLRFRADLPNLKVEWLRQQKKPRYRQATDEMLERLEGHLAVLQRFFYDYSYRPQMDEVVLARAQSTRKNRVVFNGANLDELDRL